MIQNSLFDTVEPKYKTYLALLFTLQKLSIIEIKQRKHSFPITMLLRQEPEVPGHWIPLAVVSLSKEYIELYGE